MCAARGGGIQGVPTIVAQFYERATVIRLDDRANSVGGPAPGLDEQLDNVEHAMYWAGHHERLWQPVTGCPP